MAEKREFLSEDEQKDYKEELEYRDPQGGHTNRIYVPSQAEEIAERRTQVRVPTNPNPADQDAQQRKQERHDKFQSERATQTALRETKERQREHELQELEESQSSTREEDVEYYEQQQEPRKNAKQRRLEAEQEVWNKKHLIESRGRDYEEEQKKVVERNKIKPFGDVAKEKAKRKGAGLYDAIKKQLARPVNKAVDIRDKNMNRQNQPPVLRRVQKMTKGQFHSPTAGTFPGGGKAMGFPPIDPFGGMGGRGSHMFDMSFGMPSATQQAPKRPAPAPVHKAPPRPVAKNMFPDPFAGIKSGSGKGNPLKELGKGLGIGKGTGKKLKKLDDWMKF